ncbi:hypothetical protein [Rummeliibacillus pycnus]|uniref:hypothetical protein n=1 Tax=Rummeliibacillus pycnus TaxID=101070 RepID=UPI0037C93DEE
MNRLNFRPQDWSKVEKEHNHIDSLQKELAINIERNNFATAELCAEDIISSIKEIRKLKKVKQEHERLMELAERLGQIGLNVEVVAR